MLDRPQRFRFDWVGCLVRFIVGAIFGIFFAFGILSGRGFRSYFLEDETLLGYCVLAISGGMGFVFAMLGNQFWNSLLDGRFHK